MPNSLKDSSDVLDWVAFGGKSNLPKTGDWRHLEPYYENWTPPCNNACLAGEDIVTRIRLVEEGRFEDALKSIWRANPFPSVTGRVCPHPCEKPCNRKALGGAISINAMERFLGDLGHQKGWLAEVPALNDFPMAVIGSGPAGLSSAFHLRILGHPVTVFEKELFLGGLLAAGIPSYRLPKSVVHVEIERLRRLGVKFVVDQKLGHDFGPEELEWDFKGIIVAIGLGRPQRLGIPGEDSPGVINGLEWLADLNRGERPVLGGTVAIIGGGNTAMDCARSSLRLGGQPMVVYRRAKAQMPALAEEVEEALEEGVQFKFLAAPLSIAVLPDGNLELTLQKMKLGEPDPSGRARPVPIEGETEKIIVSYIFKALGESLETAGLSGASLQGNYLNGDGPFANLHIPALACGDCAQGASTAAEAIRWGREAAHKISAQALGVQAKELNLTQGRGAKNEVAKFKHFNISYFKTAPRPPRLKRGIEERVKSFAEIYVGLKPEDIAAEAKRCFKCGTCDLCGNCELFCPDKAIRLSRENKHYIVDYDYCKGCGVCVEECPRAAIHMRHREKGQ